jgi:glycosyltransferase involved in cell wall biosynthesis
VSSSNGSDPGVRLEQSLADDRIDVLRQVNRGVSAARNVGVAAISGRYVAFLDQDDEWFPEKLERQISFMRERDLAFSDTDFNIVRGGDKIAGGYEYHHGDFGRLLSTARVGLSTMVVRRDVFETVGGFSGALPTVQDWEFALRIAYAGYPFDRLRQVLCSYHLHEENVSRNYRAAYREQIALLRFYETLDTRLEVRAAARVGRKRMRVLYAYQAIDAYRSSRRAGDIAWAAQRAPRILLRAALAKALRR